jgi:tRNA A-37 threonylcarbamoyl transferase component Bud32
MLEGTTVGAYRILQRIGAGGMGEVWLAEHAMLGRRAAVKVLLPEFSMKQEIVTRFFNEARAATAIADPGIVQIFDFGHHVDGTAYIVMELLNGEPLDKRLARQGALPITDALRIMRMVASSLGAAHARGIVHRDLKPENIFLVRDPEVPGGERAKILDFGIAKLASADGGSKTQTSAVMGTPTFMSPEQCRGAGHVDQRSDVYALGCMIFALIVGRPPFDAEGIGEIIAMHLREPPPTPSQLRPGVPPEIDQLVLKCLAKDPSQRFASAGDLAIALGALLGSSPQMGAVDMRGTGTPYASAGTPTTLSAANGVGTVPPTAAGSSRGKLIAAGLVGLAAIAGGVFVITKDRAGAAHDNVAAAPEPTPVAASPQPAQAAPTPAPVAPSPAPAPAPPDPKQEVPARMKDVFGKFAAWSRDHSGAACPDIAALEGAPTDPWGKAFRITCTDQPGDQIVGVISSGPDGVAANADDIASWQLDQDVTAAVRGTRWVAKAPEAKKPASTKPVSRPTKPTEKKKPASGGVQLDEYGLPISR